MGRKSYDAHNKELRQKLKMARDLMCEADSMLSYLACRHPAAFPEAIKPEEAKQLAGRLRAFYDTIPAYWSTGETETEKEN